MSSTDNSILFSNLSLSLLLNARRVVSPSLSLSLFLAKKKAPLPSFPLFSLRLLGQTSRESLLEKKKTTRKEGGVFLCWSSRNLSIMVFKREKKREGLQRRSVLIGEEIQLGFRVFFWFRVLFVMCLFFFSLFCFCCLLPTNYKTQL